MVISSLADIDSAALAQKFAAWGYNPAHATRVLRAFYKGGDTANADARRLPLGLVERLRTEFASGAATFCDVPADVRLIFSALRADGKPAADSSYLRVERNELRASTVLTRRPDE